MSLGSRRERCDCTRARVRKEYVDVTMFLFHNGIEAIQIFQPRHVACDRRNVSFDEGCGLLQLFLSSPSDHYVGAFFHEALGCGQANPAASACDDRKFARQFLSVVAAHMLSPFMVVKNRFKLPIQATVIASSAATRTSVIASSNSRASLSRTIASHNLGRRRR